MAIQGPSEVPSLGDRARDEHTRSVREIFPRGIRGGRGIDALTPHQRKKLEANIHETAVQAWQKFFRICEDHRKNEWKKTRRAKDAKK